ncbi:hypothetical protein [Streptomyces boluensis]|uniref:Secreted protein n=1 Tax=Streptomyces boluensis TaxID=1775135 RepID=A0A964UXN3_9ACTN|nr:hypothetical protein [Streptomyces boluensis]NBE54722.1 hypothetical protein [Streptomyces boluensis]
MRIRTTLATAAVAAAALIGAAGPAGAFDAPDNAVDTKESTNNPRSNGQTLDELTGLQSEITETAAGDDSLSRSESTDTSQSPAAGPLMGGLPVGAPLG